MLADTFVVGRHQRDESLVAHVWNRVIPKASLLIERQRTPLDGIRLQRSVEAAAFTRRAEEHEQGIGERREKEQPIAARRGADMRGRQAHAEVDVFGIAERLFDGEATTVE